MTFAPLDDLCSTQSTASALKLASAVVISCHTHCVCGHWSCSSGRVDGVTFAPLDDLRSTQSTASALELASTVTIFPLQIHSATHPVCMVIGAGILFRVARMLLVCKDSY